jgi:hypothetical protein
MLLPLTITLKPASKSSFLLVAHTLNGHIHKWLGDQLTGIPRPARPISLVVVACACGLLLFYPSLPLRFVDPRLVHQFHS